MQQFLRDNFEVIPHAPYSPDLAPSDFWLFPTMKDTLRGRTFTSRAAIASAIFQWSNKTPREAFAAAMQSWHRHFEKCVRLQGDYVDLTLQINYFKWKVRLNSLNMSSIFPKLAFLILEILQEEQKTLKFVCAYEFSSFLF